MPRQTANFVMAVQPKTDVDGSATDLFLPFVPFFGHTNGRVRKSNSVMNLTIFFTKCHFMHGSFSA